MKKIAVFITRDKFTDGLISLLEQYFSKEYILCFYTDGIKKFPISYHTCPVKVVSDPVAFLEMKELKRFDAIIISGMFAVIPRGFQYDPNILNKLYIDFWGGDYTIYRFRNFWFQRQHYLEMRFGALELIRRCAGWILEMEGDYQEIRRHAGVDKRSFVAPILTPDDVIEKPLTITRKRADSDNIYNIWLGNSGAIENCHRQILLRLAHLKNQCIRIYCPLSYGNRTYAAYIERLGKFIYKEKFVAIKDYMPKEEYFALFNSIDVAIFNNNRQQGMGNIEEMLRQGKKVYMRRTTPMWNWYRKRGNTIFDTRELKGITWKQLIRFDEKIAKRNIEADMRLRKNKWAVKAWGKTLSSITADNAVD